jgi:hypothetical protein
MFYKVLQKKNILFQKDGIFILKNTIKRKLLNIDKSPKATLKSFISKPNELKYKIPKINKETYIGKKFFRGLAFNFLSTKKKLKKKIREPYYKFLQPLGRSTIGDD